MTESHLKFIMGTEKRKIREKEQRRQAIIYAAETIIFSKGIDKATMIEIAEEAELSKGTLYLYFKNKDELYIAIAHRGGNILNKKMAKIFSEDHLGIELVKMMGEIYLDFVHNNPGYYNAFVHYEALRDEHDLQNSDIAEQCEDNRREVMGLMVRALQIGMQDGTIHDTYDPKELAVLIWASTRGITMVNHLRETDHHFKLLDSMEIKTESMFKNFLNLIGNGMATEEGKKVYD
jgi:AcrR family transcriptional regulator